MNSHKGAFENVAFNQVNLEIVLLREIVDSETLPNYFQNNNKGFSILLLNIQSFQKHLDEFKTFQLD